MQSLLTEEGGREQVRVPEAKQLQGARSDRYNSPNIFFDNCEPDPNRKKPRYKLTLFLKSFSHPLHERDAIPHGVSPAKP